MAKIVQTRRGSVEQHIGFDGQQGEVTFDLTANTLRVHDGSTFPADQPSGYPLARADMSNVFNSIGIEQLDLPDGTPGQFLTTDGAGTISFTTVGANDTDFDLGGDLSGTISVAQINANTISGIELDIGLPPTDGHMLTVNTDGSLDFMLPQTEFTLAGDVNGPLGNNFLATNTVATDNIIDLNVTSPKLADGSVTASKLAANAVSISSLDVPDGTAGQVLSTDGNGTLSFIDDTDTTIGDAAVGGDLSGTISNAQIIANAVGVTELNVADGNAGEFLQTNGAGVLSFATASSTLTGGTGVLNSIQSFEALSDNSEQTWTKPAGVTRIMYHVLGAGGSGFGGGGNSTGSGGCSGSLVIGVLDVSGITSLQLRVGRGAGASGSGNNVTTTGFNSYLGNLVANTGAAGGTGNQGTIATGSGGQSNTPVAAIGGDLRILGTSGFSFGSGQSTAGGRGGLSHWAPFGNGGSGGGSSSDGGFGAPPTPNGPGNAGIVIIFEYS